MGRFAQTLNRTAGQPQNEHYNITGGLRSTAQKGRLRQLLLGAGFRVQGLEFAGFRVQAVESVGFRVQGSEFIGFRVQKLKCLGFYLQVEISDKASHKTGLPVHCHAKKSVIVHFSC